MTVALDLHVLGDAVGERVPSRARQERLSGTGEPHDACRERHGKAFDLGVYRTPRDVRGKVRTERDRADVDAGTRGQYKVGDGTVVAVRIARSVGRVVE